MSTAALFRLFPIFMSGAGGFLLSVDASYAASFAVMAILLVLLALSVAGRAAIKRKLKLIEKLFSTLINAESDYIYLKDENYKYVMTNKALAAFYKRTPEEMVGLDDYDLAPPEIADVLRNTDRKALEKKDAIEEIITVGGHSSIGIKFPVLLPDGKKGLGAHIRDITKERRQEKLQAKLLERAGILIEIESRAFKDRQEYLDFILRKALELTESKYGYIFLYDEASRVFTLNSWTDGATPDRPINDAPDKYELEAADIWGEVVRQRKSIIVNDYDASNPPARAYQKGYAGLRRFMSVPVFIDGVIVAVVGMANKEEEYDEHDVMNLIELMGGAWQLIQRRTIQTQLAYERNRYRQTLISIGDGVMVVDRSGGIEMLNKVAEEMTGWSNDEARGRHYKEVFRLSHEDPKQSVEDPIEKVLDTFLVQELGNHALLTSKDGLTYYLEDSAAPIFNEAGDCAGVVLVFRDVTLKREQRKRIEYLSYHDQLTGLYNRSFFEEELARLDTERNLPISILMGDVNGLKLTNDIFGHRYGDELLITLAGVFRQVCRADDIIARWGGDEFVLLLPKTDKKDAESLANRIKDEFSSKQIKAIKGSVSIGISCKTGPGQSLSDTLDDAEAFMYSVKTLEREVVTDEEIRSLLALFHENNAKEVAHSEAVSSMCARLGKALGLSSVELRNLEEAGYLHDIGKIIISPDLPDVTQAQTGAELSELKKHPVVGYRILNSSDRTVGLAEAVLAHHEQWNGQGFPKGLKGEEIPLLARIISVAEYYDRLKNGTLHDGTPLTDTAGVIRIMKEKAGIQFDPRIVDVLAGILETEDA